MQVELHQVIPYLGLNHEVKQDITLDPQNTLAQSRIDVKKEDFL